MSQKCFKMNKQNQIKKLIIRTVINEAEPTMCFS